MTFLLKFLKALWDDDPFDAALVVCIGILVACFLAVTIALTGWAVYYLAADVLSDLAGK